MIGVVADDITGANDIGVMFTNGGYTTDVYSYDAELSFLSGKPDVLVLDTDSRLDDKETAYTKVRLATDKLRQAGCSLFINKTCSVFRGNIGAEFDAMLDELQQDFAVVVLGFPKNGRQTIHGVHYVHGVKLEESEFRYDPVHPMQESNLVNILAAQTPRQVTYVDRCVVELGPEALRKRIDSLKGQCSYLIVDVVDQGSLETIASAVADRYILCGSSAIGEVLPSILGASHVSKHQLPVPAYDGKGILCAAGSLMPQTRAQVERAAESGTVPFELDSVALVEGSQSELLGELSGQLAAEIMEGRDVVLHTSSHPKAVVRTKQLGAVRGLSNTGVSRLVSDSMAAVVADCLAKTGQTRFLVAGGDTSAAVCTHLGIRGMRVWKEIQPGVPSCYSLEGTPRLFVLKSGSFGRPDFFVEAIRHLKAQASP